MTNFSYDQTQLLFVGLRTPTLVYIQYEQLLNQVAVSTKIMV